MELKQGSITTAIVTMPNGKKKARPVVIVSAPDRIKSGTKVLVVGISASYRPDDPNIIPLPWRDDGNIYTGLRKPSAISLALKDLIPYEDLVPTKWWTGKAVLIELLERLQQAQ